MPLTDYIILRKIPFQESSFVVSGLSPAFGRLDLLLKGARGTGAKKFPYVGLFRELTIDFKENAGNSNLHYIRSQEPKNNFDRLAQFPDNYLHLCNYASFLLKHTRPMLELPLTYQALQTVLFRFSASEGEPFTLAAAKLVFLQESGFVPDVPAGDAIRQQTMNDILEYALEREKSMPDFSDGYRIRLVDWIESLGKYAGDM